MLLFSEEGDPDLEKQSEIRYPVKPLYPPPTADRPNLSLPELLGLSQRIDEAEQEDRMRLLQAKYDRNRNR